MDVHKNARLTPHCRELLVQRVEIQTDRLRITLRTEGLASLAQDLQQKAAA